MDAPLDLVRFANLSADLDAGLPLDNLLGREGLSAEAWAHTQAFWLGKMADDATQFQFGTTNRFNALFMARRAADASPGRRGTKSTREVLPGVPAVAATLPAHAAGAPPLALPLAPPAGTPTPVAPPSAVRVPPIEIAETQPPPPANRAPSRVDLPFEGPSFLSETACLTEPPARHLAALPFQPVKPAAEAPPTPTAARPAADAPRQATTRLTLAELASLAASIAAAPGSITAIRSRFGLDEATHREEIAAWQGRFKDPALYASYRSLYEQCRAARVEAGAEAPPVGVGAMGSSVDLNATQFVPESPSAIPALPFHPAAALKAPEPSDAGWMPQGMRGITDLNETQGMPDLPRGPALPFVPRAAGETAAPANEPATVVPPGTPLIADLGGTQVSGDAPPAGRALPFHPAAPSRQPAPAEVSPPMPSAMQNAAPRLSLEQHAWLCAELALDPPNRTAILQRYGVGEEERQQIEAFWGIRMQLDENLRQAWEDFYTAHRTQLLRGAGHRQA